METWREGGGERVEGTGRREREEGRGEHWRENAHKLVINDAVERPSTDLSQKQPPSLFRQLLQSNIIPSQF